MFLGNASLTTTVFPTQDILSFTWDFEKTLTCFLRITQGQKPSLQTYLTVGRDFSDFLQIFEGRGLVLKNPDWWNTLATCVKKGGKE